MKISSRKLVVRSAAPADIPAIQALSAKAYPGFLPYTTAQLHAQIKRFGEGTFVAVYEDALVGYCACIRVGDEALQTHTWRQITGDGYGSTHRPEGEYLYGCDVCVDPDYRGYYIGQRLYGQRRRLCADLHLKGIVFGGRLPGLRRRIKAVGSAEGYIAAVSARRLRDPVLSFQLRSGFEVIGVLKDYIPADSASLGYATHLLWTNPARERHTLGSSSPARRLATVRVASVQYQHRELVSFEQFERIIEHFVAGVARNKCDFLLFPEWFTLHWLSLAPRAGGSAESMRWLAEQGARYLELFQRMAIRYDVNIIAGSHPVRGQDSELLNTAYVFLRDGAVHRQAKLHPTVDEAERWQVRGGDSLRVIDTDCGLVGVMVSTDAEFPEVARHLVVNQGANLLFVPFSAQDRHASLRVRRCAQARAIENQCFVITAGSVGSLPVVEHLGLHHARSAVFTPCDYPFARDGVAADSSPDVETVVVADLDLDTLASARRVGPVTALRNRRTDLYAVNWTGPDRA